MLNQDGKKTLRILLTEDDRLLADGLMTGLKRLGYQVEHCKNGQHTLQALLNGEFSVLVLDLGLPDGSAIPLIKTIREMALRLPILVLTAQDQIESKLDSLNNGADDYIVKPVDIRELEARIRVLLRRHSDQRDDLLVSSSVTLDTQAHECTYNDSVVNLTRSEFILLKEFMTKPGRVLSREHLEDVCHGWQGNTESNSLDVHIHHLRKKLSPDIIRTVRGVGFMFVK